MSLRVLHVVGGLANSSGTTHIILNLAREQCELGCKVSVFYVSGRTPDTVEADDRRVRVEGFPLTASKTWAYSHPLGRALKKRAADFDVVHVHSLWLYPNLAVGRMGVPFVTAPQGALDDWTVKYHGRRKRIYGALVERKLLGRAAAIQAVSERELDNVRQFGVKAPVAIVPNGVDLRAFEDMPEKADARQMLGLDDGRKILLHLGRLDPKKGVDILIKAFSDIREAHDNPQLAIAGSDGGSGYRKQLEDIVTELNLAQHVTFLGEVSGDRKRATFAAADVFCLASHSEGMPTAALQALAAGLPLVITEGCNMPSVAESCAGIVTVPERAAFAEALADVLGDETMRSTMSQQARLLAEDRFSWPTVARRMIALYREAVANN